MGMRIPDNLLGEFSRFVEANMGLSFPKEKWADLERGIRSAACEFGFGEAESCIRWLMSSHLSKGHVETLASHLTVGETYFFRDRKCFRILEEHILPELIRSRRENERYIRIWSAGCATGEEAYSIAILLRKMIANIKDWNITILATDINPHFLEKAADGAYSEWSFRDTPTHVKERYFRKRRKGCFEILQGIREMVTFSYHNLVEDAYPSLLNNTNAMDIILCRNVVMYFSKGPAEEVLRNLSRCLVDGGWLIVSAVEVSLLPSSQVSVVNLEGAILYRKEPLPPGQSIPGESICPIYGEIKTQPFQASDPVYAPPEVTQPEETGEPAHEVRKQPAGLQPYKEALALYEQCCYAEAAEKISALLSLNHDDAKARALMARIYANQGKLAEAVEWCEKALAADKMDPFLHYLFATILQERGRTEEAVTELKRALYLDQNFVLAHFALGNLRGRQGKVKESRKHFENALSLLSSYRREDVLWESEGMTAGRLLEIIGAMQKPQKPGTEAVV